MIKFTICIYFLIQLHLNFFLISFEFSFHCVCLAAMDYHEKADKTFMQWNIPKKADTTFITIIDWYLLPVIKYYYQRKELKMLKNHVILKKIDSIHKHISKFISSGKFNNN